MANTLSQVPITTDSNSPFTAKRSRVVQSKCYQLLTGKYHHHETYKTAQDVDPECSKVKEYCLSRWPSQKDIQPELMPYWKMRNFLNLHENLLLYNSRIVVPTALRKETLDKIHTGHQGTERCCMRAKTAVWWPAMTQEIEEMVHECVVCAKEAIPRREPL